MVFARFLAYDEIAIWLRFEKMYFLRDHNYLIIYSFLKMVSLVQI